MRDAQSYAFHQMLFDLIRDLPTEEQSSNYHENFAHLLGWMSENDEFVGEHGYFFCCF